MSLTVTKLCVVPREFSVVTVLSSPKRLIPFFRKCSLAVALLFEKNASLEETSLSRVLIRS